MGGKLCKNWQFMLVDDMVNVPKIRPCLLFGKEVCGKAQEAIKRYCDVFDEASSGFLSYYEKEEAVDSRAKIKYGELTIFDFNFVFMDHGYGGEDTFNEAISFMILCEDQKEIDRYWEALSCVKEAEACGWVKDEFGLSWQIIPRNLGEIMQAKSEEDMQRITKTFLSMKKIDIAALKRAGKGEL